MIRHIHGDATRPVGEGNKIICHICNDIGKWGSGFVLAVSKRWKLPEQEYRKWFAGTSSTTPDPFKLGNVQFVQVEKDIWIANMIAQHDIRQNNPSLPPIRYAALETCLEKVAEKANELVATIHGPKFGADRAGGKWETIFKTIEHVSERHKVDVTIYLWK